MIPDHEISKCPEHEVKSKIGTIFVNLKKHLKNILLKIMKLVLIFMSITVKKYKLMKMEGNTYYLEMIFILRNIF